MKLGKVPTIGGTVKFILIFSVIFPIIMAICFAVSLHAKDSQGRYFILITIMGMVAMSFSLIPNAIRFCSTRLTDEGVEQFGFAFKGHWWWVKQSVKWEEVERVVFKRFTYTFYTRDTRAMVNVACFNNVKEVASFMISKVPKCAVLIVK